VVFLFLAERYGADVVRTLLEDLEDGARGVADPRWVATLDALLARDHGTSWAEALGELAEWSLYTGARADPTVAFARGDGLALLGATEVDSPFSDARVRLFPSSIAAYVSVPLGRSTMTAAIVPTPGSDDATAISMVVARLGSGAVREVVHAGDPTSAPALSMATGETFAVLLVRANDVASSHTPGVCIGSPSEVSACVAALTPVPDAGTPDAATRPDGLEPRHGGEPCWGRAPRALVPTDLARRGTGPRFPRESSGWVASDPRTAEARSSHPQPRCQAQAASCRLPRPAASASERCSWPPWCRARPPATPRSTGDAALRTRAQAPTRRA
jgi:hypothetical protein